jgi:hypothetical protein
MPQSYGETGNLSRNEKAGAGEDRRPPQGHQLKLVDMSV